MFEMHSVALAEDEEVEEDEDDEEEDDEEEDEDEDDEVLLSESGREIERDAELSE